MSGLGIEDQKRAVAEITKNCADCIIGTFEEHESGGNNDRPKLKEALKLCGNTGATLLVAKLDRLSRNAAFILTLIEKSKTAKKPFKILFCDNPEIDETMLGMLAIFAQHERKTMADRQKAAYRSKRARIANGENIKIGNAEAFTPEVRQKGIEAKRAYRAQNENLINAKITIKKEIETATTKNRTITANDLVKELNRQKIQTIRGYEYELKNIRPIIKEVLNEMNLQALPTATTEPKTKIQKIDTTAAKTVCTNMRANNKTFQQIADFLNDNGFMTAKGSKFEAMTVKRLIEK
ncbi:MAG: recombinase family protein [Saprospiraceae bacterium]|nr:recombinase family protein [Saprospiraceae bacterium]